MSVGVIQRLDAERIAGEEQRTLQLVPDAESEHAAQVAHHVGAVLEIKAQQHLRVARRAEAVPALLQLSTQLAEVIDLAVEDDPQPAVGRGHRLRAGLTQVDDREPAMREPGTPVGRDPQPFAVRPAALHRLAHRKQLSALGGRRAQPVRIDTGNSAHDRSGSLGLNALPVRSEAAGA